VKTMTQHVIKKNQLQSPHKVESGVADMANVGKKTNGNTILSSSRSYEETPVPENIEQGITTSVIRSLPMELQVIHKRRQSPLLKSY
jgi:hypothetical protein